MFFYIIWCPDDYLVFLHINIADFIFLKVGKSYDDFSISMSYFTALCFYGQI